MPLHDNASQTHWAVYAFPFWGIKFYHVNIICKIQIF